MSLYSEVGDQIDYYFIYGDNLDQVIQGYREITGKAPMIQYTEQKPADPIRLFVYTGSDGAFTLYEDENVNYNYEKGQFAMIPLSYSEKERVLTIGKRQGEFPGMLTTRTFEIVWIGKQKPTSLDFQSKPDATVTYGRSGGKEVLTREIKTAGAPAKVVLEADRSVIAADGSDLSFVTVKVLDADGTLAPRADNLINFEITGEEKIVGVDNGLQTSLEPFKANYRKAFNGLCLAVVQSTEKAGRITLKTTSEGLEGAIMVFESK